MKPSQKRALIIGGTGLLGRGITREFLDAGWLLTLLTRGQKPVPAGLETCEFLHADREKPGEMGQVLGERTFDAVVDCAAYVPADAEQAVRQFSGRTAHYWMIGTDFVYAPVADARFPIAENAPKLDGLPYATGKLLAEAVLRRAHADEAFPVTILRPPHILGEGRAAGCDPAGGGRDPNLPERLRGGKAIPLLAGGHFLIQPVWSREVGRCILALNGKPEIHGKIFNVAGKDCITVRHYYELAAEVCGGSLVVAPVDVGRFVAEHPGQAHIARHRIYCCRALEASGFTPTLRVVDAIRETLEN